MKFLQLDPRQPKGDQPQVDLGIEDTIGVSDNNIDHHGPEDTVETPSACEQVFAMTPLLVAETIATVRPDADSVTAMAIYKSRREHDGETSQLNDKLVWQIGMMDRFGPRAAEGFEDAERNEDQKIGIAIAKIASNFRKSMDERVALVQQILEGDIDQSLALELEGLVQQRDREFVNALAASEVVEVIPKHLAFVKSSHRFATQIGYAAASTLVAFNPEMPVMAKDEETGRFKPTGETYRKFTICRYDSHVKTDISAILGELNALESGWGGRGDIIGSPQNTSSELSEEQVLAIVEKHVQLGKIRHELKAYGESNQLRGLEGRMQRGLDPAGMIAVQETLGKLEKIGNALGADLVDFIRLTNALHVGAIWKNADRLAAASDPVVRLWMILAEVTVSGKEMESDMSPEEFMKDFERVNHLLDEAVADPEAFAVRAVKQEVESSADRFEMREGVPYSQHDGGFLAMAIQGKKAGIVEDGDGLLFVGSDAFDYSQLADQGLTEVKRNDERRGGETVFWVDAEGNDVVKILYPGFAIVFGGNLAVAQAIVKSIPAAEQSKQDLGKDCPFIAPDATAESVSQITWGPVRRAYGAVPGMLDLDQHLEGLQADKAYFARYGQELGEREMNSCLLYRLKFGTSIVTLVEEILALYSGVAGDGRLISVFGLSGSGKSLLVEGIKETLDSRVITIDSDSSRMNLFGKIVKDLEMSHGADLDEVRNHLMHNALSGPLYLLLNFVSAQLKEMGYVVVEASTGVNNEADEVYFVEHRSIDPREIPVPATREETPDEQFTSAVAELSAVTDERCPEADTFDWENGEQEIYFNDMKDVVVKVPSFVHGIFIGNVKKELAGNDAVRVLSNPEAESVEEAKQALMGQFLVESLSFDSEDVDDIQG